MNGPIIKTATASKQCNYPLEAKYLNGKLRQSKFVVKKEGVE